MTLLAHPGASLRHWPLALPPATPRTAWRAAPGWMASLGLTGVLIAAPAAHAQAGAACNPQSTAVDSLNACAVQQFQEADTAQNILYADVMRALSAHERPALRQDQTQWSRQRTRDCKAQHAADEGLGDWPARYHHCLTSATQARRTGLLHWLHHGEPPTRPSP